MSRNTRRGAFPARSQRIRDWGVGPQEAGAVISADGKLLWSAGTAPIQNLMVIRTRGWISYYLLTTDAAGGGFRGASGIYLMTEDAFAVGATAVLDPLIDSNSDMWLWHSFFDVRSITATIADGVNAGAVLVRQEIDSKAMRKGFDPERVMVGVTGVIEGGTSTVRVQADTRQLFLS